MQPWFLVLMAVGNQPGHQMNDKIERAAMSRMLNLRNVFELVDNRLDDDPFAQEQLLRKVHEMVLHVFAQPGDEMQSLLKKELSQGSRDVAPISKELAS